MPHYHCAMHPELSSAWPGVCPECGLTLTVHHAARHLGYERHLPRGSFEQARVRVRGALEAEGFRLLTEIDVTDTLKTIAVDFRRYLILGACDPTLAYRALEADPRVGLLLPFNVILQDAPGGGVDVSVVDPRTMFTLSRNPALLPIVDEADQRLRRVIAALA